MRLFAAALLVVCLAGGQSVSRQAEQPDALRKLEQSLEKEVAAQPTAALWEKLGLTRHLQNRFEDATFAFRAAIRLQPTLWTSHLFLGICLYRTNQFTAALESIKAAERFVSGAPPGRDDVDYWLAATHVALKQPLPALRALETLLKRNPRHTEALELAARTANNASTALWNEVAEKSFESAPGYEVHGYVLESEGNRAGAMEAFRRSHALAPRRPGPALALGRLLLMDGKADEALTHLNAELRLPGANPAALYYAGLAAVEASRYPEAAERLKQAAEWSGFRHDASVALVQVYFALNETGPALSTARNAAASYPGSPAAHELLIAALERAGKKEEAQAERARWLKSQPRPR